jgi:hypothetical protein
MNARILQLAFVLLGLIGCATPVRVTRFTDVDQHSLKPKPSDCAIDFLRNTRPEGVKLLRVAKLDFATDGGVFAPKRPAVERWLSQKACELGADAVVIDREHYAMPYISTDVSATAVVYAPDEAP